LYLFFKILFAVKFATTKNFNFTEIRNKNPFLPIVKKKWNFGPRKNGRTPKQPVSKRPVMKFKKLNLDSANTPETKTASFKAAKIHNAYIQNAQCQKAHGLQFFCITTSF
jgi:hypothetical protein